MSRHHHRADLDSPVWWLRALFVLAVYGLLLGAWLVWALIVMPVAGVAKVRHNDDLAQRMVRSLGWKIG